MRASHQRRPGIAGHAATRAPARGVGTYPPRRPDGDPGELWGPAMPYPTRSWPMLSIEHHPWAQFHCAPDPRLTPISAPRVRHGPTYAATGHQTYPRPGAILRARHDGPQSRQEPAGGVFTARGTRVTSPRSKRALGRPVADKSGAGIGYTVIQYNTYTTYTYKHATMAATARRSRPRRPGAPSGSQAVGPATYRPGDRPSRGCIRRHSPFGECEAPAGAAAARASSLFQGAVGNTGPPAYRVIPTANPLAPTATRHSMPTFSWDPSTA